MSFKIFMWISRTTQYCNAACIAPWGYNKISQADSEGGGYIRGGVIFEGKFMGLGIIHEDKRTVFYAILGVSEVFTKWGARKLVAPI